jgi:hypothetical protein
MLRLVFTRSAQDDLVRRFPYDIYYRITERQLVVVLLFHTARDPESAIARLQPPH